MVYDLWSWIFSSLQSIAMHYDLWSIIQIKLIMPTETLEVGFHWLGDRAKQVISKDSDGREGVGVVLASSFPAIKWVSNDSNYHNYFTKYYPSHDVGKPRGTCLVQRYEKNVLVVCGVDMAYVNCNLRSHIKTHHKELIPYKVRYLNSYSWTVTFTEGNNEIYLLQGFGYWLREGHRQFLYEIGSIR